MRLPGAPCLGSFPETDVRLYSVDRHGRRGARSRIVVRVGERVDEPTELEHFLYSPGVPARFGRPARPAGIPTP